MNGKQWSPLTKFIWFVFLIGVPMEIWGWLPVLLVFIAFTGVFAIFGAVAVSKRREGAAREDAELDAVLASWREAR